MKFTVPSILNDAPTKAEWKRIYPENGMQAKLAYLAAKKVYIRNRLAEAQNWRCCWCFKLTIPEPNRKDSATIEHVTPRCQGGADHPDNYAMSCADCNQKRGTKTVELFMEIIQGKVVIEISKNQKRRQKQQERRKRQDEVINMLKHGANMFPEDSKEHRMYERYSRSDRVAA